MLIEDITPTKERTSKVGERPTQKVGREESGDLHLKYKGLALTEETTTCCLKGA